MKDPTMAVIVLSYNRPKMLREALGSIKDADEVVVVDDGSDFDVVDILEEFNFKNLSIIGVPPIPIEERLVNQRLPGLINEALKSIESDIVTYLCDDDVFDHFARYEIAAEFRLLDGAKGVEDARLGQCIARKECHVYSHAYSMNILHCTTPDYSLSGKACSDVGWRCSVASCRCTRWCVMMVRMLVWVRWQ
jgi:glycosyltransferase involved in cell wall biosynthesis